VADYNLLSDTNIHKNTYKELVCWVKELSKMYSELYRQSESDKHAVIRARGLEEKNYKQAARIMELEFDLRKYSTIMVEDKKETVMADYGVPENNVIPFNDKVIRPKRGGGSGGDKIVDWLSPMEWGTQFYARQRGQSQQWMLVKFMLAGIRQKTALLVPMMGAEDVVSDDRNWLPVDPVKFCRNWELFDKFPPLSIPENSND
jgi:hypothetical protein